MNENPIASLAVSPNPFISPITSALFACLDALLELSENPAFSGDAPEFNRGGIGYEACETARDALGIE